ncbi:DUF4332 domain-containing protein [Oscillatoria sp. CS-180]|uniref:DUF4332 domain-containing protein n=1 Tax=Oscillatoria sp. CS-180 TaxID=3021720 RepID=UPI0023310B0A|nr:DUF4332 domain-containing protein [Oscillatoria sp. CS-180]MDB9526676.1 DUF4332 domain-containing protein [Oscillatoria sp. CS-180]
MSQLKTWLIEELPGLSKEQVAQLQSLGLQTTQDLLRLARSPQNIQKAAQRLNLPLRYLQKWIALADLSQLPSVGCQYCGLLLHSGIASVSQLAAAAPGRLHSQIRKLHTMTLRRADLCPTADQVVNWVREAKLVQGHSRGL